MSGPVYVVTYPHSEQVCQTGWPPMAEAAWHRATRDTFGGYARCTLTVDGHTVVTGNSTQNGIPWPRSIQSVGPADLYKALLLLAHQLSIGPVEMAAEATEMGLPLSRANIDDGRRGKGGSLAELFVLLHSLTSIIKKSDAQIGPT